MLLAYEKGAELIVAVGTHSSMVEFLDKGRAGMASTFLVRMKVGADPRRRQGREPALPAARFAPRDLVLDDPCRRVHPRGGRSCCPSRSASCSARSGARSSLVDDQLPLPHRLAHRGLPRARHRPRPRDDVPRPRHRQQPGTSARRARERPRPAQARNDEQQSQLDAYREESTLLGEQLGERLYEGLLGSEPVLVVSTRGIDGAVVDGVVASLVQADADVLGVWWLTDRLLLDDDSDVAGLSDAPRARHRRRRPPRAQPGGAARRRALRRGRRVERRPGRGRADRARARWPSCARAASSSTSSPTGSTATSCACPGRACAS